jgi:hypothetical protein
MAAKLDLFSSYHLKTLEEFYDRDTAVGGIFSAYFIIVSAVIVLYYLLFYSMNNITEYMTLIPFILTESNVKAPHLSIIIELFNYGDSCTALPFISENEISYDCRSFSMQFIGNICKITAEYSGVQINGSSFIDFSVYEPYAYATWIQFSVSSVSGVPNYNSSIKYFVTTNDKKKVFKGSLPTILNLLVTPSVMYI